MTFTIQNVIDSIANQLARAFPDGAGGCLYPIKQSPSLDTEYPCFFVFHMPSSIEDELSRRQRRELAFDIVFVQQRNLPDPYRELVSILETLDESFDMIDYTDGLFSAPLHVLTRNASIEDQELHFKITMKQRVATPRYEIPMLTEDLNVEVEEQTEPAG